MADIYEKKMISAYFQEPVAPVAYFSGMFQAPEENFFPTEKVELDVQVSGQDVAIAVQNMRTDYRLNEVTNFVNKEFTPPVYKEAVPLNSFELLQRMAGENPYQLRTSDRAKIVTMMLRGMRRVEFKIRRAIELQAAQVLQNGAVDLTDENGATLYTINYGLKPTHFPVAGVSWATSTLAEKEADLEALAEQVNSDSYMTPDTITFGNNAWKLLTQTTGFYDKFDVMNANVGTLTLPTTRGNGGIYRGRLEVGSYTLDVFTYNAEYKDPQTGNATKYMDPNKVIIQASGARMDALFGAVPNIGKALGITGAGILPELPTRFTSGANRIDMSTNVWLSEDGNELVGGVATRPLMVPTAGDSFGTLTVIPPA